ncbi:hypothetical protein [Alloyangia pacifica]|uniref:hypothetical protein n=1 Tax=Alloyangia pacifica TaxID=311180 RepID=UPI001CD7482F|nr:hypothetical protein [Alloyangia pacifica]MCA0993956.1 hypothetical protein [Alloyangia pacifica]
MRRLTKSLLCLVLLLGLAACGRPLTPNEVAFLQAMQGPQINTGKVRFHDGLASKAVTFERPVRPRLTCMERIWPPSKGGTVTVSPAALTLFNHIFYREDVYLDDYMASYPERLNLYGAMLFAHEMTHVWQWQNRARTGYTPLKAATEHQVSADPYLFDPEGNASFLSHGYEQQGAIVEEYVCCQVLDPSAPRTSRLRAMISKEMPIGGLDEILDKADVIIPWKGAETRNICH